MIDHPNEALPGSSDELGLEPAKWTGFVLIRDWMREKVERKFILDYKMLSQRPGNYPENQRGLKKVDPVPSDQSELDPTSLSLISDCYQAITEGEAREKAFIAACDVAIYFNAHHKVPATLTDAGFNEPNPLTNAPFEYSPTANGFHLVVMHLPAPQKNVLPTLSQIENRNSDQYSISFR